MHTCFIAPRSGHRTLKAARRAAIATLALVGTLLSHAATAFVDGEAIYLERIMPPPDATLVVTLQDASRAGAPAIERASTSLRVSSGPPYPWRLVYDTSLGDPQRLTVRARIITPAGLWMTTDTKVSALGGPEPLRLRLVSVKAQPPAAAASGTAPSSAPPPAPPPTPSLADTAANACASAATQADMNRCAYEDFEAAGSDYAPRYKELSQSLPNAQRDRLRRMQSAWLKYRTEACRFESGASTGGSVQTFIYWRCAARMTRERTLALQALAACREGDVTCARRVP